MQTERKTGLLLLLFVLGIVRSTFCQRQNGGPNANSESSQGVMTAGITTNNPFHPYHYVIPTTPSPENINCYVEVVPPVRLGGVCKRMGRPRRRGRRRRLPVTWACQSGVHLEIGSPHCSSRNRRRRQMNPANN